MTPTRPPMLRSELREGDEQVVREIVTSTGFFSPAEIDIAVELVEERRAKGDASGYYFQFLEVDGKTVGYACYGPIPATAASYDLYWIAVAASARRQGIGRQLMTASEADIRRLGGVRVYVDTSSRAQYDSTRAFYRAAGYEVAAELPEFYGPGDGKVIFCKVLPG